MIRKLGEIVPEEESRPEGPDEPDMEASETKPDEERIEEEKEEPLVIRRCFSIPVDLSDDIDMINKELGSTFSSIVRVAFSDPRRYRILLETAKNLEAGMSLEKLALLCEERASAEKVEI